MKTFNTYFEFEKDSYIRKLAEKDWERREAEALAREAAEIRQQSILEALNLAPHFELHRLPLNFWVAQIIEPAGSSSPLGEMPQAEGASFSQTITGCTDLHHITPQILFFRSNLPEQEIRENIDLSFSPF